VRDTFVAILVVGVMVGAYVRFGKHLTLGPEIGRPSKVATVDQRRGPSPHSRSKQGVMNGEASNRFHTEQAQGHGEDEGAAVDAAEIESLTSIYQGPRRKPSRPAGVKAVQENSKFRSPDKPAKKVLYGVPVEDFVLARQDNLPAPVAADTGEASVRVFVQCMELKKDGPEGLAERECARLAKSHTASPALAMKPGARVGGGTSEY
jgi:hypothetical protein